MTFGSSFGRVFSPTFQPKSQAAATASSWWLAGGIAAANCVAAYQAKGAASYAASKVNLANPGTYDAADGSAYPTWDSTDGWKFAAASSQYLNTGFVAPSGGAFSGIVKFTNGNTNYGMLFGCSDASKYNSLLAIANLYAFNKRLYANSGYPGTQINGNLSEGVLCIAGTKAYANGTDEGITLPVQSNALYKSLLIGAWWSYTGSPQGFNTVYIQAISFYNTAITAPQVAALTTAMNAL